MNQHETMLLIAFLLFYLPAIGLFHFMVFRVNSNLSPDRRIPHSLYWGGWGRLQSEYRSLYPRSRVYQLTLWCTVATVVLAASFFVFRFWEYLGGR
jgi:hypothetical protein